MKWAILITLVSALTASGAPSDPAIARALGGYERAPTADGVKQLGPDADRVLISVASDARTSRVRRMRAIYALRFVPSAEALTFLRAVLDEKRGAVEGADVLDLAAALGALSAHGPEVAGELLPFLTHRSADVRQAAAAALAHTQAPEAPAALRARLVAERDPGVRAALSRLLGKGP
jgi:hypothetical protein